MNRSALALLVAFALGCAPAAEPPPDGALPDPICSGASARYQAGTASFVEVTSDLGLDQLPVEGTRVSAADLDGDGFADLVVRRGGFGRDDLAAGARFTWILKNDGGGGFVDVTEQSGALATRFVDDGKGRPGEVWAFGDVDNDGDLDIYTGLDTSDPAKSGGETSELLLNEGGFTFALGPRSSALRREGDIDVPAGASFVDFDLDGNLDLWVAQHNTADFQLFPDRLYKGDGSGSFVEVGQEVGIVTEEWDGYEALNAGRAHSRAWAAAACDLNHDGYPELLAPAYGRSPNHLWQAVPGDDGAVSYENRSVASGFAYDENQGWQDNQFARCFCQQNPTADGCADVPAPAIGCSTTNWSHEQDRQPFRLGGNSAAVLCGDVDNDGDLDLMTSEIRHWWAGSGSDAGELLVNGGAHDVTFARPGREATGLVIEHAGSSWDEGHMTGALFDFDNDGWLDVYVGASDYPGNRGRLFHQGAALSFAEVPTADFFEHHRSHGVAVADFDRDGDLDVVVGHSRARCEGSSDCYPTSQVRMFANQRGGNFLQLALEGRAANRSAIGARVTVTTSEATQTRVIGGGHGHYGAQDDLVVHVGLGAACEAEVDVEWPGGESQRLGTLPAGHRLLVVEGQAPRL